MKIFALSLWLVALWIFPAPQTCFGSEISIHFLKGNVTVLRGKKKVALTKKFQLQKGDIVQTGKKSFVKINRDPHINILVELPQDTSNLTHRVSG